MNQSVVQLWYWLCRKSNVIQYSLQILDHTACRLRQIREREQDATGPSDEEHKDWIARLAHASATERASRDASLAEEGSRGRVSSPPCSPARPGEASLPMGLPTARTPWKASSQQAIPLKGRRQHGSSNALSLMHMSPSPAKCQTLGIGLEAGCPDEKLAACLCADFSNGGQ